MEYKTLHSIKLNGKEYSKKDILEYSIAENTSHLEKVIMFLKDWFSESKSILVKTSGSTGKPKEITIPKQSFVESAKNTCDYLNITSSINALLCIPVEYIGGKMMVIRALVSGYNLLVQEPNANPLKNQEVKVDFIAITPYQLHHIAGDSLKKLEEIEVVLIGGGKINSLLNELISTNKNRMYATFGMTETVSHIALKKINDTDKSKEFTVLDAYKISKTKDNCLVIDCPTLHQETITTNDIVEITAKNKFRWLGRKDNIINSGGIKICPEEIEEFLSPFLLGLNFYITSVPDEILGNKLVLKYCQDGIVSISPRLSFINSKLEKYKTIKEIIEVDRFDYTETGKVIRE